MIPSKAAERNGSANPKSTGRLLPLLLPDHALRLADLPCSLDVRANLAQQVVKVGEGSGRTQARQEIEFHGAAVEVAGEADEMGFDLADLLAEGRVRADVAGGRPGPRLRLRSGNEDSGGIDAVERDQGIDAVDVDRRNAQPRAPTCAVGHNAPDAVRAAEKSRGLLDLALVQRLADSRRRDELAMVANRLDHLEFDAGPGTPAAEDFHIALPIVAECEVRSLNHAPRGELALDHAVEELAGGQVEQPASRPEGGHFGRPGFLEQGDFSLGPYQGDGS